MRTSRFSCPACKGTGGDRSWPGFYVLCFACKGKKEIRKVWCEGKWTRTSDNSVECTNCGQNAFVTDGSPDGQCWQVWYETMDGRRLTKAEFNP